MSVRPERSAPESVVAPDPEAAYYQTIEEFFVSRRGDPLFLSNADWVRIRDWRLAGIPLRVVLRGIADALDGHALSWSRDRKVGSLAYCAAEVEVARDRWQRALALGSEDGIDLPAFLERLAGELEQGERLAGPVAELASRLAAELRERSRDPGSSENLEAWLAAGEGQLLAALRQSASTGNLEALEAGVDHDLAPYAGRMPEKVLRQIRAQSVARRLLEQHRLPRLSLFGL